MNCVECSSPTTNPKFCGKSCAAKHNNKKYPKRFPQGSCKKCTAKISSGRTYCKNCWTGEDRLNIVGRWLSGEFNGGGINLSETIRRYLIFQNNYACQVCKFSTPHPVDGRSILEINHKNGDGTDHRPENLEVLCPNCHALTPTYRGRNQGSGRPTYYIRKSKLES